MKNSYLADFHHGWLIEITPLDQGFKATCYSPCRKRLVIQDWGLSNFDLLHIAKQAIDYQVACSSLSKLIRELYETKWLDFDEWKALHHSLNPTAQPRR